MVAAFASSYPFSVCMALTCIAFVAVALVMVNKAASLASSACLRHYSTNPSNKAIPISLEGCQCEAPHFNVSPLCMKTRL